MSNGSRSRAPGPGRASRHPYPRPWLRSWRRAGDCISAVPYELGRLRDGVGCGPEMLRLNVRSGPYSIQPSSRIVQPAFQIFVMWLIFPSSNSIA